MLESSRSSRAEWSPKKQGFRHPDPSRAGGIIYGVEKPEKTSCEQEYLCAWNLRDAILVVQLLAASTVDILCRTETHREENEGRGGGERKTVQNCDFNKVVWHFKGPACSVAELCAPFSNGGLRTGSKTEY